MSQATVWLTSGYKRDQAMSQLGQKRRFEYRPVTSGSGPDKQTNSEPAWTSQLGQFRTHALQQRGALFDYLIGAGKDRLWDAETERLGGLKIDHEIEAGRPFHG